MCWIRVPRARNAHDILLEGQTLVNHVWQPHEPTLISLGASVINSYNSKVVFFQANGLCWNGPREVLFNQLNMFKLCTINQSRHCYIMGVFLKGCKWFHIWNRIQVAIIIRKTNNICPCNKEKLDVNCSKQLIIPSMW